MSDRENGGLICCVSSDASVLETNEGHCDGQVVMPDSGEWVNDTLLDLRLRVDDEMVESFCERV